MEVCQFTQDYRESLTILLSFLYLISRDSSQIRLKKPIAKDNIFN